MSLYFVTGMSGSGKSAVRRKLLSRGFEAYDTDEDGLAAYHNNETGEPLDSLILPVLTPEFREKHTWKASKNRVEEIAAASGEAPVFVCGVVAPDIQEWKFVKGLFALMTDAATLEHRILTRTDNNYGKAPHELKDIMGWQKNAREYYRSIGATIIDACQPVDLVTDEIVLAAHQPCLV